MVVTSLTYPLTLPHAETSIVYLPSPLSLGCHLWMTPKKNSHRLKCFYLYSVLVNMIYTYVQQTVQKTKSSHIKVSSQLSFIHYLVFEQQNTIWIWDTHRKNDPLTRKFIKNHHMIVTFLVKHSPASLPLFLKHLELTSPPSPPFVLAKDVIYGWPLVVRFRFQY